MHHDYGRLLIFFLKSLLLFIRNEIRESYLGNEMIMAGGEGGGLKITSSKYILPVSEYFQSCFISRYKSDQNSEI